MAEEAAHAADAVDSPYESIDWDELARRDAEYEATRTPKQKAEDDAHILGQSRINSVRAVGGPFDGMPLTVPPGATEVIMPAAYGKDPSMRGKVFYRRRALLHPAGTYVWEYAGQGDFTEQLPLDDED